MGVGTIPLVSVLSMILHVPTYIPILDPVKRLSAAAMHMAISEIICKLAYNWIFCAQNYGIYSYVDSLKSNLYISYYLVLSRSLIWTQHCFLCKYIPGTYCKFGYIWLNRGNAAAYPPLPPLRIRPTTRTPS